MSNDKRDDMRNAAQAKEHLTVEEDADFFMVYGESGSQKPGYVMYPHTVGLVATGKNTLPGSGLESGPIFGGWPGMALIGTLRDEKGEQVKTETVGSDGMMVILDGPQLVLQTLHTALGILLTSEQAEAITDMVEAMALENGDKHTPNMLVERAMHIKGLGPEHVERVDNETMKTMAGLTAALEANDLTMEQKLKMAEIMAHPTMPAAEKYEVAKQYLSSIGVIVMNLSDIAGAKKEELLKKLRESSDLEQLGEGPDGKAYTATISGDELLEFLTEDQKDSLFDDLMTQAAREILLDPNSIAEPKDD